MRNPIATVGMTTAAAAAFAVTAPTAVTAAQPAPFKQTNIHFETNASACDMGIQMSFDTDGITEGEVTSPYGQVVFSVQGVYGSENTDDLTEMFHERVEPPISDLIDALGCEREDDESVSLAELFGAWPAGWYRFEGESGGEDLRGRARLTHKIPAGPEIRTPADGSVVPHNKTLPIRWKPVTEPLLPYLGPVQIVGYHLVIADVTQPLRPGQTKTQFDADLAGWVTYFPVPAQFLRPNRIYEFEVLATESSGNQTITEGGVFCTPPIAAADCEAP